MSVVGHSISTTLEVAAEESREKVRAGYGPFREYVSLVLWCGTILIFFANFVWQNFKIPTSSMENSILIGDHITLNAFIFSGDSAVDKALFPSREPRRGDMIVFKFPGDPMQKWVKRVVGLPGEQVVISEGRVWIDGRELEEPYTYYRLYREGRRDPDNRFYPMDFETLRPGWSQESHGFGPNLETADLVAATRETLLELKAYGGDWYEAAEARLDQNQGRAIPEGFYLVMGDNRNFSDDSRRWGLLPAELVEGKPYWIWWSYGEDEGTAELSGPDFVRNYMRIPFTLWTRTHWERCFTRLK